MKRKKSVTLIEIMVVIIIIGILATLSVTYYGSVRERAIDREAQANLRLVVAAERVYGMETGGFYAGAQLWSINDNLRVFLPIGPNRAWNYRTTVGGVGSNYCVEATRTGPTAPDARTWRMRDSEDEPQQGQACP